MRWNADMMDICFFSGDITRGGGTERVATVIANGLSRTGKYRISFLSLVEQKEIPFYVILPEIDRYVLKDDRQWVRPGIRYFTFLPALRRFLEKQHIDILVDIDLVLDILSLPAAMGQRVKVVSWEHFNYFFERKIWYRRVSMWLSGHFSDCIVTLSERDRQHFREMICRRREIIAIENPIRIPTEENTVEKEKILITVGQMIYRKGIDMLAQIVPKILGEHKEWKWYFLGDGEYMGVMKQVQSQYGLEERLILPGIVEDVENYLNRSSIMVMGSREEGLAMCLLEAMAWRVPCIAFDIPTGPLELISHGINGFLISPFDLEDMTGKISLLMEDDVLLERFMQHTTVGMEKFCLETVLKKWEHLFGGLSHG